MTNLAAPATPDSHVPFFSAQMSVETMITRFPLEKAFVEQTLN